MSYPIPLAPGAPPVPAPHACPELAGVVDVATDDASADTQRLRAALARAELALAVERAARRRAEAALHEREALLEADVALRESEARFRQLAEHAPLGVFVCDATGAVVYQNPHLVALAGQSADALRGAGWMSAVHPNDAARAIGGFTAFLADPTRDAHADEVRLVRPDGTTCTTLCHAVRLRDATGTPVGYVGTATDVTDQRASEEALRASEGWFRGLIEHAHDMVAVLGADGAIQYVSPSHARMTGYTLDDYLGSSVFERIHPDDRAATQAAFARALASPGGVIEVEYRYQHKDGSWHRYATAGTNLLDDPYVRGVVVNSQDVTERNELEAQLRQAQKLDAVGRLAGGVAHDFNNLLMVIGSHAAFALDVLEGDAPAREEIEAIGEAARRAAALTRQLLAFSRKQIMKPEVLDLNAVVRGLEPMLRRLIGEDIAVHTRLASSLGAVVMDPVQLEQVIVNLALNARDAMPAGGRLVIETRDVTLAESRATESSSPGTSVRLIVRDTGVGMDEVTRQRAFEPFFTTKGAGKGTGLGLATVYGIVQQSGGAVRIANSPGAGTTFEIDLPRATTAAAEKPAEIPPPPHVGHGTVLLVEDEPQVRSLVRRILERAGYAVLEAASGSAALALVAASAPAVDLVVTDMVMAGMSGRDFADALVRRMPGARVLFMSGYTDDEIVRRGLHSPGMVFLEKPFTAERLLAAVRASLESR